MHRVFAQGPKDQIQKLSENHFTEYENYQGTIEKHLNFETIIPSPDIVRQTQSGSSANLGAYLLDVLSGEADYQEKYDSKIGRQGNESAEAAIERFFKENPECQDFGRLQRQCLKGTGVVDWYDWNILHWGTKWNACEGKIESVFTHEGISVMEFTFETAWSVPEPVWVKLAEMFPDVVFRFVFFDEGWNFAGDGCFNSQDEPDGFEYYTPDDKEPRWRYFYFSVYHEPCEVAWDGQESSPGGE
jgi:hypothetical protein